MKKLNSIYSIQIFQILLILLTSNSVINGQIDENVFTDERDGKKYELIEVDKLIWFAEDLRYETNFSHKHKRENKQEKYFYTNNNLDSLCPYPFRIPTAKEWEKAITELYHVHKTTHKKVKNNNSLIF